MDVEAVNFFIRITEDNSGNLYESIFLLVDTSCLCVYKALVDVTPPFKFILSLYGKPAFCRSFLMSGSSSTANLPEPICVDAR